MKFILSIYVLLAWSPSPDLDVTGYWLYIGASTNRMVRLKVSDGTNRTLKVQFPPYRDWWVQVTATNLILESDPSNALFITNQCGRAPDGRVGK